MCFYDNGPEFGRDAHSAPNCGDSTPDLDAPARASGVEDERRRAARNGLLEVATGVTGRILVDFKERAVGRAKLSLVCVRCANEAHLETVAALVARAIDQCGTGVAGCRLRNCVFVGELERKRVR